VTAETHCHGTPGASVRKHGVFLQQLQVQPILVERDPGGRLVVDAGNEAAGAHEGLQPLELRPHGRLALVHRHLVIVADHPQRGKFGPQRQAVDARFCLTAAPASPLAELLDAHPMIAGELNPPLPAQKFAAASAA